MLIKFGLFLDGQNKALPVSIIHPNIIRKHVLNVKLLLYDSTCNNCGLMLNDNQEFSSYSYEEPIQYKSCYTGNNTRLKKMQNG